MARNEFVNAATLSGRIIGIYDEPNDFKVKILQKADKKANRLKEDSSITVHFIDEKKTIVKDRFKCGDMVTASCLIQTVRNHYTCSNKIELWGLSIFPVSRDAKDNKYTLNKNFVRLSGKVASMYEGEKGNNFITVYTAINRPVMTPSGKKKDNAFHSYTTIAIPFSDKRKYEKGDWVEITGFVTEAANKTGMNSCRIRAQKILCAPANEKKAFA